MRRYLLTIVALELMGIKGVKASSTVGGFGFTAAEPTPMTTPFTQFYREVMYGDFVAAATSLANGSGTITVSGIPTGADIVAAYLFYTFQDNGGSHAGNFNGTPISGTLLGSDCTSCWGTSSTTLYYADVTSYVTGNGTYTLDGFDPLSCTSGDHGTQGATLVVIYCGSMEPKRAITIYTGVWETYCSGWSYSWDHSGFTATSPVTSAKYSVSVGNGQSFGDQEYVRVNGNTVASEVDGLTPPTGGPCGNGSLWDHFSGNATTFIPSSATSVTFSVDNVSGSDCWHPVVSVLSLTVTDDTTYTCTAGYDDPTLVGEDGTVIPRNGSTYEIYTVSGSLVYRGSKPHRLPPGIYFIVSGSRTQKVIIR